MSTLCTLNNLVNAYAALMRANKPETVSIVLILTVCSSHLYTYLYEHYNGSSATPGLAISRVYIGVGIGLWLFMHIFMGDPGAVLQMGH